LRAFAERLGRARAARSARALARAARGRADGDPRAHARSPTSRSRCARAHACAAHADARRGARGDRRAAAVAAPLRPLERLEEHRVPGAERALVARLYVPPDLDGPRPLILYFHQGGYVIGELDWLRSVLQASSRGRRAVQCCRSTIARAPEHRFPAAQDDAWAAYRYALEHAGVFGGDPERIGVGGDSAGGGLAAMIAQRAHAERVRQPRFQLLIYPWLIACADNAAYRDFGACPPLLREDLPWFLSHYLNSDAERDDVRLAPGLAWTSPASRPRSSTPRASTSCATRASAMRISSRRRACRSPTAATSRCRTASRCSRRRAAAARALAEIARDVDLVLSGGAR
jgi:acetyl esterase/lipase